MDLVVIEGPGKRDTLKKYLGDGYDVFATKGHVIDLPVKTLAIDINNNFEPNYTVMPDKENIIKELKQKASKADNVLLATDPDREGEAISWHIENVLNIPQSKACRVVFNEISKNVVQEAVKNPRIINMNLVHAQQGRRVLDRLVGYKISPILCKKIKSNLSAGRVQSVTLKLVVDREKEINNFKPVESWNIVAELLKGSEYFCANLVTYKGKKFVSSNEKQTLDIVSYLNAQQYIVASVKKSVTKSSAPPPFITSTMQQDALNKLGMTISRTTKSAQQLYEGVEIKGEGKVALITYIRTDSTRVSPQAQNMARDFIINKYGAEYAPATFNTFKVKKLTQDAHEAIRPITLSRTPESIKDSLAPDNYKLYKLIYERFVASQMADATYNSLAINIDAGDYGFKATGRTPLFLGYTLAYKVFIDVEDETSKELKIKNILEGDILDLKELKYEQKFSKPPTRYTEASLVKTMEDKGIGRPATYAPTIMTLANRNYTAKEGKYILPTELGITVTEFLEKYFEDVMNISFTADMENNLDGIETGTTQWQKVVADFYAGFEDKVYFASTGSQKVKMPVQVSDVACDKCGAMMVVREGKYGKFLACPNFPRCKNIKDLVQKKKLDATCPLCGKPVVERKTKRGTIFYGCSGFPNCKFASWDVPLQEKCPVCQSYLLKKEGKKSIRIKCSNEKCNYSREEQPKKQEGNAE